MGKIRHEGVIQSIDEQGFAMPVMYPLLSTYATEISLEESMGFKAVFLAFILPFLFMVGALVGVSAITHDEPLAALAGIIVLIPYYWVLFTRKDRLKKQFQFKLETNQ